MTDKIRWCWTCGTPEWTEASFEDTTPSYVKTCEEAKHDVADALVVRADQPVYQLHAELFDYDKEIADMMADGVLVRIGAEI